MTVATVDQLVSADGAADADLTRRDELDVFAAGVAYRAAELVWFVRLSMLGLVGLVVALALLID